MKVWTNFGHANLFRDTIEPVSVRAWCGSMNGRSMLSARPTLLPGQERESRPLNKNLPLIQPFCRGITMSNCLSYIAVVPGGPSVLVSGPAGNISWTLVSQHPMSLLWDMRSSSGP